MSSYPPSHNDLLSLIPLDLLLALGQAFLSFDPSQSGSLLPVMETWSMLSFIPQSLTDHARVSSGLVSHYPILGTAPGLLKPI